MLKTMAVIPARMGSTRLAGKPLALIQGKPMVRLVYENTVATELFDDVVVATTTSGSVVILAAGAAWR
jgi:3-deoxy-manno-octulosonate cytidylyltransferase (CMP-KDO synthetase)